MCRKQANREADTRGNPILTGLGMILCVIFGTMLLFNLVIIGKGIANPDVPPSVMGVTPMAVLSGSMSGEQEGHIEVGDLIFIHKTNVDSLKEGDVISYMEGNVVVTHRIVEKQTAEDGALQFVTKGDANNVADSQPVDAENVVGIYTGRIPKLGDFAMFLQKPVGMLLFIGLPLFAFVGYDIIRRQRYANKGEKERLEMQAEIDHLRSLTATSDSDTQQN